MTQTNHSSQNSQNGASPHNSTLNTLEATNYLKGVKSICRVQSRGNSCGCPECRVRNVEILSKKIVTNLHKVTIKPQKELI